MIQGFKNKNTQKFFEGREVAQFTQFKKAALRKLDMLDADKTLADLLVPPGNRSEALFGERSGSYSIRINKQL
jgi:proteic killer suppression protein